MKIKYLCGFVCISLFSCIPRNNENVRNQLVGEWEQVKEMNEEDFIISCEYTLAMQIGIDTIDFYLGFWKWDTDTVSRFERKVQYLGSKVPYTVKNNNIIVFNPITNIYEQKWKFIERNNDTLLFSTKDGNIVQYKKIAENIDTTDYFDRIIFSSSACYGSCPIMEISLDDKGNIYYHGDGCVKNMGFYSANISLEKTNEIFNKFKKAKPMQISDYFTSAWTDDATRTTTFIKNGKIVKSIYDYGCEETPKELMWAYYSLAPIHDIIKLDTLSFVPPFFPYMALSLFKNEFKLYMSESFYLWSELHNSKITDTQFIPKYKTKIESDYWEYKGDNNITNHCTVKQILSDGRYFKLEFIDCKSITYDLGYNFVERNGKYFQTKKRLREE